MKNEEFGKITDEELLIEEKAESVESRISYKI